MLQDLEKASGLEPGNREVAKQLDLARLEVAERKKEKEIRSISKSAQAETMLHFRRIEQLVQALQLQGNITSGSAQVSWPQNIESSKGISL